MEPQPEDEDAAPAVRLSSITGLPRERCAELLEAARGDLDLAASRAFKLQQLERLGAAGPAAPDPMAAPPATLTILGGVDVQYPRASASILAQHIYLVVELRGERQRTEAVRRTARPRWAQAQFEVELPADGTAAEVRLTMCDLDDNVIGSGEAALEVGAATSSADVQLLSAADLPEQCGGVAGVIQLELRAERVLRERRRTEGAELDTVTLSRGGSAPSATSGAGLMARQMRPARGIEGGAVAGLWSRCDGCQSLPQKGDGESQLADLRDCPHAICRHCLVQVIPTPSHLLGRFSGLANSGCSERMEGHGRRPVSAAPGRRRRGGPVPRGRVRLHRGRGRAACAPASRPPRAAPVRRGKPLQRARPRLQRWNVAGHLPNVRVVLRSAAGHRRRTHRLGAGGDGRRERRGAGGLCPAPRPVPRLLAGILQQLLCGPVPLRTRELPGRSPCGRSIQLPILVRHNA